MRVPRVRFTVRRMMIAVAILAVICLGGREFGARWLRRAYRNPVAPSRLVVSLGKRIGPRVITPGGTFPVSIFYNFRFANLKPPSGSTCLLRAEVWLADEVSGRYVDGYTFGAPLTVGGREQAAGSFTWEAKVPHAGRYALHHQLGYVDPSGEFRTLRGGGRSCDFVAPTPSGSPGNEPGAVPR